HAAGAPRWRGRPAPGSGLGCYDVPWVGRYAESRRLLASGPAGERRSASIVRATPAQRSSGRWEPAPARRGWGLRLGLELGGRVFQEEPGQALPCVQGGILQDPVQEVGERAADGGPGADLDRKSVV